MLRNVYPAEFQIHPRNTNLWNTVTKWWWYISARYRYPDPYSTRGGSVRQSLALLGAETATPSAPIRHRDPFAAIESRKLFFSRKSSIIDKSLLFSSAFFPWELIINEREILFSIYYYRESHDFERCFRKRGIFFQVSFPLENIFREMSMARCDNYSKVTFPLLTNPWTGTA